MLVIVIYKGSLESYFLFGWLSFLEFELKGRRVLYLEDRTGYGLKKS